MSPNGIKCSGIMHLKTDYSSLQASGKNENLIPHFHEEPTVGQRDLPFFSMELLNFQAIADV
jgi:hypothetical protein